MMKLINEHLKWIIQFLKQYTAFQIRLRLHIQETFLAQCHQKILLIQVIWFKVLVIALLFWFFVCLREFDFIIFFFVNTGNQTRVISLFELQTKYLTAQLLQPYNMSLVNELNYFKL